MLAAVLLVLLAACTSDGTGPEPPTGERWPDRVAVIGDSITTAAVPDLDHLTGTNPELSWATGGPGVGSYLVRLRERNAAATGENVAVPGARIRDAAPQADRVVAAGADLVLVLLGANDVCAAAPPTAAEFGAGARQALDRLAAGLPDAAVFVVSVPDVAHLREALGGNVRAQAVWQRTGTCPAALAAGVSADDLAAVRERQAAYNAALFAACDAHPRCDHDDGAVTAHRFSTAEVSAADFFHPSVEGQRRLAELVWAASTGG